MKQPRRIEFVRFLVHGAVLPAVAACATPPQTAAPTSIVSTPAASSSANTAARPDTAGDAWWAFLGKPSGGDERAVKELDARLRRLPAEQVLAIHRAFEHELLRCYRWELWGAAYIINGGCSDDCFDYFRGWLLLQGKDVFDAALRDPDSLATLPPIADPPELEEALYLTAGAYRAMTGREPQRASRRVDVSSSDAGRVRFSPRILGLAARHRSPAPLASFSDRA